MSHFSLKWGPCEGTYASTECLVNGRRGVKTGCRGLHFWMSVPPGSWVGPWVAMGSSI